MDRLKAVLQVLDNDKSKLVIDLSCRRKDDKWFVATNKWQTITDFELNRGPSSSPIISCVLTRHRLDLTTRAILLRVLDTRCRCRRAPARHRPRTCFQARRMVQHPGHLCWWRQVHRGFGTRQEAEQWQSGPDYRQCAGHLRWLRSQI
jgi:hypothetical protein